MNECIRSCGDSGQRPRRAGRIAIFDGSWYRKVLIDRFEKRTREKKLRQHFIRLEAFEKQLTDGGTILVKLLLDIDQKEQKKRFEKLLERRRPLGGFLRETGREMQNIQSMQP